MSALPVSFYRSTPGQERLRETDGPGSCFAVQCRFFAQSRPFDLLVSPLRPMVSYGPNRFNLLFLGPFRATEDQKPSCVPAGQAFKFGTRLFRERPCLPTLGLAGGKSSPTATKRCGSLVGSLGFAFLVKQAGGFPWTHKKLETCLQRGQQQSKSEMAR